jgi:hypothetical protein
LSFTGLLLEQSIGREALVVDKIPIKKPGIYLILISSTFLAMWILALIPIPPSYFKPQTVDSIYILSLYLFSFFIPTVGLLLFLNHIKKISSRWYWGVPLLFTIVLITLNRDNNILGFFYETSFTASYSSISHFLSGNFFKYSVQIVFSLSMLLFVMSVPENKRNKMSTSFRVSLFTLVSVLIFTAVDILLNWEIIPFTTVHNNFWGLYVFGIFIFGLSLFWTALHYETE